MKRMILALLLGAAASPALAQHSGHTQPAPPPPPASATTCTPEHAAMGHCAMPAPAPQQSAPPTPTCTAEHAAMGHCTMSPVTPARAPAATCTPEHAEMGHCAMPTASQPVAADPRPGDGAPAQHAGLAPPAAACSPEHAAMGHCTPPTMEDIPVAPPPRAAFVGPAHAQDLFFDPLAAARSRAQLAEEHGGLEAYRSLVDQLEASIGDGADGYAWDAQFWYGGDIDKLWLKTEGEGELGGELEAVEAQALWSHAIGPFFDLQAGVRQDLGGEPDRTHLVLGVQGLTPYWFEVDGAMFLSNQGDITARAEIEYDLRITQNLILQPRGEIDFSLQDVPELGLGSGLSQAQLGARLRYELFPRSGPAALAPYIGVQYARAFSGTARFRRFAGEDVGGWRIVAGVRTWF